MTENQREHRKRSSNFARTLTAFILGTFVVAAIGEGFACAFLWDRLTEARTKLADRDPDSKSSPSDGDAKSDPTAGKAKQSAGKSVGKGGADEENADERISNAPTSNAPTSNAPTSNAPTSNAPTSNAPTSNAPTLDGEFQGNEVLRFELETEIARMQSEQQAASDENARLRKRLDFLTQRLDDIVLQREQLAATNRRLEREDEEGTQVRVAKPEAGDLSEQSEAARAASTARLEKVEDDGFRAAP